MRPITSVLPYIHIPLNSAEATSLLTCLPTASAKMTICRSSQQAVIPVLRCAISILMTDIRIPSLLLPGDRLSSCSMSYAEALRYPDLRSILISRVLLTQRRSHGVSRTTSASAIPISIRLHSVRMNLYPERILPSWHTELPCIRVLERPSITAGPTGTPTSIISTSTAGVHLPGPCSGKY